jgi:hemoglobin/transferrin/lactoferrin receptor protein
MRTLLAVALGIGLGTIGLAARAAEEPAEHIDEVIVVAHKSERSIRDVAANVTVLTEEDISVEMATSIADILRYTPGVDYEGAGTRFGTEGVNIRGIGGNRVALLVDGVPLSDQFDVGSFSNATRDFVNAGFVRRAEVLHGPASAIYGSAAIGGVVALRSPNPDNLGRRGGSLVSTWREADSSLHATALQGLSNDSVGLLLGASVRDGAEADSAATDPDLDRRSYRRRSAILKLVADDALANTWQLGYYGQSSDVDSSYSSLLGAGRFRSTTRLDGNDRSRFDMLLAEYQFGESVRWLDAGVIRGYVSDTDVEQRTLDERALAPEPVSIDRLFAFEQSIRGIELNLQKSLSSRRSDHTIGAGLEYRRRETSEYRDGVSTDLADGTRTNVLLGEVFPLRDFPVSRSTDWGAYLEDSVAFDNWTLIAGVRGDRYELDPVNDPLYAEDYPFADPVAISVGEISPKIGLIYRLRPELDVYAQYTHGFRAPPYEDANIGLELPLFNIRAVPNPGLRSERSDGIDVGVRWRGVESSFGVAVFRTRYADFIESKARVGVDADSGRILFQSRNLNAAVIEGFEVAGSRSFALESGMLVVDGAFYRARGRNEENGLPLNSVGPAQAVIGIDWQPQSGRWQTRLLATFTDGWSDRDETAGALFKPPGHAVFDLYLRRKTGEHASLRMGVTNLTNRIYWTWSDVRGLSPDDPVIPYLARPGRSAVLGIDMSW